MGQAAVAWIRNTAEEPERRPTDIGWLVFAAIGVAVVGVWAQSQSEVDANFFAPLNDLSSVDGVFKAFYALGSIWALGAVALVLLVFRQVGVAWRIALAGVLAWGVAELLHEILPAHSIAGSDVNVRIGDGPVFPTDERRDHHRARRRLRALRGPPAPTHPLPAHPARGGRGDVPRRGIPVGRARWLPARDRRGGRGARGLRLAGRAAHDRRGARVADRPRLRRRRPAASGERRRHARR